MIKISSHALVTKYYPEIKKFSKLTNYKYWEDLAQEVCVKLLKHEFYTFNDINHIRNTLRLTCFRKMLEITKKESKFRIIEFFNYHCKSTTKEFDILTNNKHILKKLKNHKELSLRYLGYSYNEIASMYDLPLGTVKCNINRSKKQLTKEFKKLKWI